MNSQIQRAARRYVLGEVVAGVTHEVRNALQGAFGHLWLAGRKPGMPPEALEHLNQVEEACEDAMRILSNTLDLARRGRSPSASRWCSPRSRGTWPR